MLHRFPRIFRRKNLRLPPDRGKETNPTVERLRRKIADKVAKPKKDAAMNIIEQIKASRIINNKMIEDVKDIKVRLFILDIVISDQISKDLKMSANNTMNETVDVKVNSSGIGTPGKKTEKQCPVKDCSFQCVWKSKMENHLSKIHGIESNGAANTSNSDTVNTTIFNSGLGSPSKTSTQTPETPAQGPKNGKRARDTEDDDDWSEEPNAKKGGKGDRDTSINDNELVEALQEAEDTANKELIEKIMKKAAGEKKFELEEEVEVKEEGTEEKGEKEKPRRADPREFCVFGDIDDSTASILITEEESSERFTTTISSPEKNSLGAVGKMLDGSLEEASYYDIKDHENDRVLLAASRSNEEELRSHVAVLMMKLEKADELREGDKKNIKHLEEILNKKDKKFLEVQKKLASAEKENETWKQIGKEYLSGQNSSSNMVNKDEIQKMKKKLEEITKKLETAEIQKERAVENAKYQKDLADRTQKALVQEQGEHAKTKRKIPCEKTKCEDTKKCPWGHPKENPKKKINRRCDFFNPLTGKGCRKGDSCAFLHIRSTAQELNLPEPVPLLKTEEVKKEEIKKEEPKTPEINATSPLYSFSSQDVRFKKEEDKTNKEEVSMEVDNMDEVKVVGVSTASPNTVDDYKTCEEYQKKLLESRQSSAMTSRRTPFVRAPSPLTIDNNVKIEVSSPSSTIKPSSPHSSLPSPSPSPSPVPTPSQTPSPSPSPTPSPNPHVEQAISIPLSVFNSMTQNLQVPSPIVQKLRQLDSRSPGSLSPASSQGQPQGNQGEWQQLARTQSQDTMSRNQGLTQPGQKTPTWEVFSPESQDCLAQVDQFLKQERLEVTRKQELQAQQARENLNQAQGPSSGNVSNNHMMNPQFFQFMRTMNPPMNPQMAQNSPLLQNMNMNQPMNQFMNQPMNQPMNQQTMSQQDMMAGITMLSNRLQAQQQQQQEQRFQLNQDQKFQF